ncbi:YeeE/YedE family protein [Fischerella thermalis]|uniref:YeeE/YedE family protein n=1 Tax=Fischerella thermalis TaxID=372787 RepID=UPI000C800449|nr:YeeE/YedE family protein [Fischerella thermalis]MBF1990083.1 YeeE/YedE family protein [Fischerella thermalis M58_A2018_009]MBF2060688.1 YeeE/YedE family protein [Fischerella thermalis M66_A2018_004]MBF2070206.1 YeeE/YedE family protein [Fischerella thermalis M48_A2018_028]PLZ85934.1 YeeE/YedE family protein [Fischerella thermalis CCMEE 5194]
MAEFNWFTALIGGILIGISATLLLAFNGRIAGISGIINGAITFNKDEIWRWMFILGMLLGGVLYEYGLASQPTPKSTFAPVAMIIGGFLVGFGTRMGSGCTSGHGVCGLGRLSLRSLVAVLTFLTTAIITVFIVRHVLW